MSRVTCIAVDEAHCVSQFPCLTIIYCPSRKDVDKVSEELLVHRAEMIHQMELYLGYK